MNAKQSICEFRAAAKPKAAELLIYGPIVSSGGGFFGSDDDVTPKGLKEQLVALGEVEEITVLINSPGGDPFAGHAIYNMLKRHEAKKHVYIDGIAASAASLIAMAGDTITMPLNALMLVHQPSGLAMGTAKDMRAMADNLDQVAEAMAQTYMARTGKSREEVMAVMDAETLFTAEEAVEAGFADELDEAKKIAASISGNTLTINGRQVDLTAYRSFPREKIAAGGPAVIDPHQAPASQAATEAAPDAVTQARLRVLRLRARS